MQPRCNARNPCPCWISGPWTPKLARFGKKCGFYHGLVCFGLTIYSPFTHYYSLLLTIHSPPLTPPLTPPDPTQREFPKHHTFDTFDTFGTLGRVSRGGRENPETQNDTFHTLGLPATFQFPFCFSVAVALVQPIRPTASFQFPVFSFHFPGGWHPQMSSRAGPAGISV